MRYLLAVSLSSSFSFFIHGSSPEAVGRQQAVSLTELVPSNAPSCEVAVKRSGQANQLKGAAPFLSISTAPFTQESSLCARGFEMQVLLSLEGSDGSLACYFYVGRSSLRPLSLQVLPAFSGLHFAVILSLRVLISDLRYGC